MFYKYYLIILIKIKKIMSKKVTTESFIQKAKEIHGDKYDYSQVIYTKAKDKVSIICPIHGIFLKTPDAHIQKKQGCPHCTKINKKKEVFNTESFINKANQIHNFKYNYDKVTYTGTFNKVCIICPEHGEFWQTPAQHLQGSGCSKCVKKNIPTTEEWITQANEIHYNKYDYSKTKYVNCETKVCIICPIHGEFWQRPTDHIYKHAGCPKCSQSHGEKEIENLLRNKNIKYINQFEIPVPIKIRMTGIAKIDFYLPDYNTFIEYNGKQHYIMQEGFGGQLKFDNQLKRDEYVRVYCKRNNINLIEIPYTDKNFIETLCKKLNI